MNSTFIKHTLKNGLRVILVPDQAKDVVTTMALVGTGSRYERDDIAGISHILEHMFYKGTKKRPSSTQVSEFIEEIGGEFNAFTSKEYTGFYTKVAAKHLPKSLDFISDLLINPLFREEELKREKLVILQEYDMYEDLPMEVASSKFEEALYGKNSLGRDVIGYRKSISSVTRADLVEYLESHYTSTNIVLVIAGNLSALTEEALIRLIENSFTFKAGSRTAVSPVTFPKTKGIIITQKKTEQTNLSIGYRGLSYSSPQRYSLKLLATILGGSMSSRMFTEIREKRGLAYVVRTVTGSYLDTGMINTFAGVPHDKAKEAISAIIEEYDKMTNGASEGELNRAKEIILGKMLISFEDTNELASHYAQSELLLGRIITPLELSEKYKKATLDDLSVIAKETFNSAKMAISVVGPNIKKEDILI